MHPTKSSDHHSRRIHECFWDNNGSGCRRLILVNAEEHPIMPGQNRWRIFLAIVGPPIISHNSQCLLMVCIPTSLQLRNIPSMMEDGIVIKLVINAKAGDDWRLVAVFLLPSCENDSQQKLHEHYLSSLFFRHFFTRHIHTAKRLPCGTILSTFATTTTWSTGPRLDFNCSTHPEELVL